MSHLQIAFEIGHVAYIKSKATPEGFTHDWELYVRPYDNHDISPLIDKMVFNLHDTFPKPKRSKCFFVILQHGTVF